MASIIQSAVSSATAAAHSAVASLAAAAQIKVGDAVPDVTVKVNSPTETLNFSKLTGKNVIVTVPAAFSPSCSEIQVPEYISRYEEFSAKGIQNIYILSVNDIFVMKGWKKDLESKSEGGKETKVIFVADDIASFSSSSGLIFDASPLLGGPRAKRSAMVIENGKVLHVAVEDEPPQVTVSSADSVLKSL